MSLNVGPVAKEQLNIIEAGRERFRKSLLTAAQRKSWTQEQAESLFHVEYLIGVLEFAIRHIIHDNQPTAQQKRP